MPQPIIEVKSLRKKFVVGKVPIQPLRGINFSIDPGEFAVVFGPSGCGKTTLLNMLAGLDRYDSGEILIRGKELNSLNQDELAKYRRCSIGMVFQNFNLISSLTTWENVALPLTFSGISKKERKKRAEEVLEEVGLKGRANHKPSELSGGEQQKVAIARALVMNPWILLVDEPTGNLDTESGREIIALLDKLNRDYRRTILLVTHNPEHAAYAGRILHMKDGQIAREEKVPKNLRMQSDHEDINYFVPSKLKNRMRFFDLMGLAYKHFKFAKTRSFLTVLGMVIGIGAIILFVSLGFGLQKITTSSVASLDDMQTLTVTPPEGSNILLDENWVNKVKAVNNIKDVSPILDLAVSGTLENTTTGVMLKGILPDKLSLEQVEVLSGKSFSSNDSKEAIISATALKSLDLAGTNVVGQPLKISLVQDSGSAGANPGQTSNNVLKILDLTIVGAAGETLSPVIYVPLGMVKDFAGLPYSQMEIKVSDVNKIDATKKSIEDLGLEVSTISSLVKDINKAFAVIQIILGLIGGIALIVATLGIINTMTISLLERTKEIGVMKAIGISRKDVKRLFLDEATLFGIFGGVAGIVTGWLIGSGINKLVAIAMQKSGEQGALIPFITPYKFAILILVFSIFITRLAGYYPAWRADRSSPLEALRYE